MQRRLAISLVVIAALLAGGYYAYQYIKELPPTWLIKLVTATRPPPPPLPEGDEAPLTVPEGWRATIYSREAPGARVLVRDPQGAMVASLMKEGKIVALPDADGNGVADESITVLANLRQPHGMLFMCPNPRDFENCRLYVAETGKLD